MSLGIFKKQDLSQILSLDLPYFIGGGFWLTFSTLIVTIGGIFLSSLFARALSKEIFGQYSFLMSILGLVTLTSLPGMSQAIIQGVVEGKDGIFRKAIFLVAKWSVLGSVVLIIISAYYYLGNKPDLSMAIIVSALAFPISAAGSFFNAFLTGKKQFRLVAVYGIFAQLASISATVFALLEYPNLVSIALFSAWSTAIVNLILTYFASKHANNNFVDEKLVNLGFHLSFSQVFTIGADYLDRFLVPILLGFTSNAIYTFAILIPLQMHAFLKTFTSLGQPKVAGLSSKNLKHALIVKSLQLEAVIAFMVLIYIVAAPTIFKLLFPAYVGKAVLLSQLFSLSLLYYPGNILSLLLVRERKSGAIYSLNVFYAFVTVTSLFAFIPVWGLFGAVLGRVFIRYLQLGAQIYLFSKTAVANRQS